MEAVDGADGNTRCSKMGHYCCPVGLRCAAYQDVGDSVGDIDSLSDMELLSRHWHDNSRHWHCNRHWCCIWLDVFNFVGGDDVLQSVEDPCLLQVKML